VTDGIYFDAAEANLACKFMESLTVTSCTKSNLPEPMVLLPQNRKLVANLFGWRREDGRRLITKVFYTVARKNTKTQTAAAIGLYCLLDESEMRPYVAIAAKDREQASECYDAVAEMIHADEGLSDVLQVTPSSKLVFNPRNRGKLKALSSEGKTKHGSNPSVVILDEFHVWDEYDRELYDALTTGSGARKEPLLIIITTAGVDEESMCYKEYAHAKRIMEGAEQDPTYLPIIHELPKDADWTDESLWPLANPALSFGLLNIETLRGEVKRALAMPSEQNRVRRLFFNQWVNASEQWIPLHQWDACAVESPTLEDLRGRECYGGLDLAAVSDLTAFVLAFPLDNGEVYVHPWFWIPQNPGGGTLADKCRRDNVRYDLWERAGHIETTPGNVTDWRFVTERIKQLAEQFQIREIGFDRYGARDTAAELGEAGIEVVDVGQGYLDMSPACKRLEELVLSRKLKHSGNPVLRWNIDCCTVAGDPAGNIKPVKPERMKSSKRIDGVIASVMAVGRAMKAEAYNPCVVFA
jgi:phage terminase large subunit-like protein